MSQWHLVNICHGLPEYKPTEHSAIYVSYLDVLSAMGKSEKEVAEIDQNLKDRAYFDMLFG
jgi:outer membrane receptor for monomeric catechols